MKGRYHLYSPLFHTKIVNKENEGNYVTGKAVNAQPPSNPPPPASGCVSQAQGREKKRGGLSGVGDGATHRRETILEERRHLIIRI